MPVVYLCGFNGHAYASHAQSAGGTNLTLSQNNAGSTLIVGSPDNGINRMFGYYDTNEPNAPTFVMIGRKHNNNTMNGYVSLTMGPSTTDPTVSSLSFYGALGTVSDYFLGWGMRFDTLGWTSSTSFRVGVRVYRRNAFTGVDGAYAFRISNVSTDAQSVSRLYRNYVLGEEVYIEVEWLADSKTLNLYVDDEMVQTTGPNFTTYNPWESISFYTEVYNGGTVISNTHTEFKDLYVQRIDSEADIRLGSATRVWPFRPASDDDVQYLRPSGFNSNAAVAAKGMTANTVPQPSPNTDFLSATEIGQHDMYNTDATNISAKLATVEGVAIRSYAANPLAGTRSFAVRAILNGSLAEAPKATTITSNTGFKINQMLLTSDPNGTRWTPATVAALKIGTTLKS